MPPPLRSRSPTPSAKSRASSRSASPAMPPPPKSLTPESLGISHRSTSPIPFEAFREIVQFQSERQRSRSPGPSLQVQEGKSKTSRSTSPFPEIRGSTASLPEMEVTERQSLFGIPLPKRLSRSRSPSGSRGSSRSVSPMPVPLEPPEEPPPPTPVKRPTILGIPLPTLGRSRTPSPTPRPRTPRLQEEDTKSAAGSEDSFKDAEEALIKAEAAEAASSSVDVIVRVTKDGNQVSVTTVDGANQKVSTTPQPSPSPVLPTSAGQTLLRDATNTEEFKRSHESVESDGLAYASTDDDTYTVTGSSNEHIDAGQFYETNPEGEPEEIFTIIEETAQELEENEKEDVTTEEGTETESEDAGTPGNEVSAVEAERDKTLERILVMMEKLTDATAGGQGASTPSQSSTPTIQQPAGGAASDSGDSWKAESCPDLSRDKSGSQRDLGKEVEFALENIMEMKTTMTKMMQLLESNKNAAASEPTTSGASTPQQQQLSTTAAKEEDLIDRALDAMIEGDCKMVDEIIVEVEKVLAPPPPPLHTQYLYPRI